MIATNSKHQTFTCNCLSFLFYGNRVLLGMGSEEVEIALPPDVEGIADQLLEITGWSMEDLLLQTLITNYPEISGHIADHPYCTDIPGFSVWFVLPPESYHILQNISQEYKGNVPNSLLIASLLRLGSKDYPEIDRLELTER